MGYIIVELGNSRVVAASREGTGKKIQEKIIQDWRAWYCPRAGRIDSFQVKSYTNAGLGFGA